MMNQRLCKFTPLWLILALSLAVPSVAMSKFDKNHPLIEIEIVADNGDIFPIYPVNKGLFKNEFRAYLEAIKGKNYTLRVHNRSNQRLGLVIAIDGRNIISGEKSHLKNHEEMYILDPYEMQTYSGWRASDTTIHRFYFTDIEESYAHAFGDDSAMGVVAVAVFVEDKPKRQLPQLAHNANRPLPVTPDHAPAMTRSMVTKREREAGTGFGEYAVSHVSYVHFNAEHAAQIKYFYRYEWRETLCQKKIIDCEAASNRFWPQADNAIGFAPYPPHHHR